MDPPRKYLIHSLNPWRQFLFIWRQKHFFSRQFLYMDPVSPGKGLFCPNFFFHFFNAKGAKLFFHQENSLFSTGQGLYAPIIFYHFFKPRVESYFFTRKIIIFLRPGPLCPIIFFIIICSCYILYYLGKCIGYKSCYLS